MMRKINLRKLILFILIIAIICILKNAFISSIDGEGYAYFIRRVLVSWDESQFLNIIWLLPIMFSIYIIARNHFFKIHHFDTRYNNRKHFINKFLIKCCLSSIIVNFLIAFLQVIVLSLTTKTSIMINIDVVTIFVQYIIESTFLNIVIILCAMYIKNFMYTYIIFLIFIILSLTIIVNLSLVGENPYLPFINIYYSDKINVITILLTIAVIYFIKKLYIRYDILGGVDQ